MGPAHGRTRLYIQGMQGMGRGRAGDCGVSGHRGDSAVTTDLEHERNRDSQPCYQRQDWPEFEREQLYATINELVMVLREALMFLDDGSNVKRRAHTALARFEAQSSRG